MVDFISSGLGTGAGAGTGAGTGTDTGADATWVASNSLYFIVRPVFASFKWTILMCDHSIELFNFVARLAFYSVNWTILC